MAIAVARCYPPARKIKVRTMSKQIMICVGTVWALLYFMPATATTAPAKIWITMTDTSASQTSATVKLNDSFTIQNKGSRGLNCSITHNILNNLSSTTPVALMPGATLVSTVINADSGVTYLTCSQYRVTITYVK